MESIVTSKFQTTIPKAVRENLKIKINDAIDWKVENGKVIVTSVQTNFLKHKNSVSTGKGNIKEDIQMARKMRADRYR